MSNATPREYVVPGLNSRCRSVMPLADCSHLCVEANTSVALNFRLLPPTSAWRKVKKAGTSERVELVNFEKP